MTRQKAIEQARRLAAIIAETVYIVKTIDGDPERPFDYATELQMETFYQGYNDRIVWSTDQD